MNEKSFFSTKVFPTFCATKFFDAAVRFDMQRVMCLWIHCKPTDITMKAFNSKVHNVEVVNHMRLLFESKRKRWKPESYCISVNTHFVPQRSQVNFLSVSTAGFGACFVFSWYIHFALVLNSLKHWEQKKLFVTTFSNVVDSRFDCFSVSITESLTESSGGSIKVSSTIVFWSLISLLSSIKNSSSITSCSRQAPTSVVKKLSFFLHNVLIESAWRSFVKQFSQTHWGSRSSRFSLNRGRILSHKLIN